MHCLLPCLHPIKQTNSKTESASVYLVAGKEVKYLSSGNKVNRDLARTSADVSRRNSQYADSSLNSCQ